MEEYESPWHYSGSGLDEPMPFSHPDLWWDFRMVDQSTGERWYPSPREVMSYESPYMSVRYQNDFLSTLIPDYEPNPNIVQLASDRVRTKCRDRGWNEWWRRDRSRERERDLSTEIRDDDNDNDDDEEEEQTTSPSSPQKEQSQFVENDLTVSFKDQFDVYDQQQKQQNTEIELAVPETCRLKNQFSKQSDQEKCKLLFCDFVGL
jgi:hypothetical protein